MKKIICIVVMSKILSLDALSQDLSLVNTSIIEQVLLDQSFDMGMKIWTDLDLISAIRTSSEDLIYFADQLIDQFLDLRELLILLIRCHMQKPFRYDDIEQLNELIHQIDERFNHIFAIMYSKEVACGQVLLERILNKCEQLWSKGPTQIETEDAAC